MNHLLPVDQFPEIIAFESKSGFDRKPVARFGGRRASWMFLTRWPILWPALILLGLTVVFRWTPLDLWISGLFFDPDRRTWPWFHSAPCLAFYHLAIYPPLILAGCGAVTALLTLPTARLGSASRAGWFLVLLIAIGPGLIVNVGFKQNWGRPRPHEVKEFGGAYAFTPVGSPGAVRKPNTSFPSGHAAIAFFMMAPGFLVSARKPRWAQALLACGSLYGLAMGATRVVQGGHFTSDVLWAGGVVYLTGALLARWLLRDPAGEALAMAITPIDRPCSNAA